MSRGEGFDVMDLSTSWHDDPKWKVIWRRRPDLIAPCAYVYTVLAAESWRIGTRLTVQDAWPPLIVYDAEVVGELMHAKLIDRASKVLASTWRGWFEVAAERRTLARARNRRANDNRRRGAETAHVQRGDSAVTSALPTGPIRSDPSRAATRAPEGWPNLTTEAMRGLEDRTGQPWSLAGDKQLGELDRLIGAHGAEAVFGALDAVSNGKRMTARQLIWPALRILEPFPDPKAAARAEAEHRESERSGRAVANTVRQIHGYGGHNGKPDPRCPECSRAVS